MKFSEKCADFEKYLCDRHKFGKIDYSLRRIREFVKYLGPPPFRTVQVVGTNGKGSTAAIVSHVLRHAGFSVGRFTSPHLVCITDRYWLNGRPPVVDRVREAYFKGVVPFLDRGGELSFFETTFAVALVLFYEERVQWAVLEAGLGGRLDATSAVVPDAIILTSVARDHVKILGGSLHSILNEKVAQWRGQPLFANLKSEELKNVLRGKGEVKFWGEDFGVADVSRELGSLHCDVVAGDYTANLRGCKFWLFPQEENFALAASFYSHFFGGLDDRFTAGCESAKLPGRGDVVRWNGKLLILDGAHNPQSLTYLFRSLREVGIKSSDVLFFLQPTKDLERSCNIVSRFADRVLLTLPPSSPKVTPLEVLENAFAERGVKVGKYRFLEDALCSAGDFLVVCGSFYLVSDVYRIIISRKKECSELKGE